MSIDKKHIKIEKPFKIKIANLQEGQVISEEKFRPEVNLDNQTGYSTEKIEYYIDEKFIDSSAKPPYVIEYNFFNIINGEHKLIAVAINENNDKTADKKGFLLTRGLKIHIKSPSESDVVKGPLFIKSEVLNKTSSPVDNVEYFLDNKSIGKVYNELYSLEVPYEKAGEGKHRVKAVLHCKDGSQTHNEINIEVRKPLDNIQ
jgi:hypothetical protein